MDREIAGIIEKHLAAEGVNFRPGEKVIRFNGENTIKEVVTDKGAISADLVILSLGVILNVELA